MNIILSTRNPSKAEQIKAIFNEFPYKVLTLEEARIPGEAIEDGSTLEENALKKARFAHKLGSWAMADDTGIFITALNGEPGIRSARWAGEVTTEEITSYCLKRLEGKKDRSAYFETVVAVIDPEGRERCFNGKIAGSLLEAPRTKPQPKMPYSPLFVPNGKSKCWAEMTVEEENKISHRGKAFAKVRAWLESQLQKEMMKA